MFIPGSLLLVHSECREWDGNLTGLWFSDVSSSGLELLVLSSKSMNVVESFSCADNVCRVDSMSIRAVMSHLSSLLLCV